MKKLTISALMLGYSFTSVAAQETEAKTNDGSGEATGRISVRLDCLTDSNLDKGETQPCFSLSGLRFLHSETLGSKLHAHIVLDPFASVNNDDHPDRSLTPLVRDTDLVLVDQYAFTWVPRPHLEIGIEKFFTVTDIPDVSGLSMGSALTAKPWSQTALSFTYNLSAFSGTKVKFVAGNGEGENARNLDPQQFFGFLVDTSLFEGLNINLGASLDGNNVGSDQYNWRLARYRSVCGIDFVADTKQGFSYQRLAIGLELDGKWQMARGLKVGLGWQRNVASDLSKSKVSLPNQDDLETCPQLAVENLLVEDPEGDAVNTVQNRVIGLSSSYRILDTYTIGFDYETRLVDSGSVQMFKLCEGFIGTTCASEGQRQNTLTQSAYTFGGGLDLADQLNLTLEYNRTSFDKNYTHFYYVGRNNKASDTAELFNVRIAYNWD